MLSLAMPINYSIADNNEVGTLIALLAKYFQNLAYK